MASQCVFTSLAWEVRFLSSYTRVFIPLHETPDERGRESWLIVGSRFEKLDITPKSAQKIKPVLERWMKEAEERWVVLLNYNLHASREKFRMIPNSNDTSARKPKPLVCTRSYKYCISEKKKKKTEKKLRILVEGSSLIFQIVQRKIVRRTVSESVWTRAC